MEKLREMLVRELDKITNRGDLSVNSLDAIDKLTHSIKSIDTVMAMHSKDRSKTCKEELRASLSEMQAGFVDPEAKRMITEWMNEL